jgi:hypothetical protein
MTLHVPLNFYTLFVHETNPKYTFFYYISTDCKESLQNATVQLFKTGIDEKPLITLYDLKGSIIDLNMDQSLKFVMPCSTGILKVQVMSPIHCKLSLTHDEINERFAPDVFQKENILLYNLHVTECHKYMSTANQPHINRLSQLRQTLISILSDNPMENVLSIIEYSYTISHVLLPIADYPKLQKLTINMAGNSDSITINLLEFELKGMEIQDLTKRNNIHTLFTRPIDSYVKMLYG